MHSGGGIADDEHARTLLDSPVRTVSPPQGDLGKAWPVMAQAPGVMDPSGNTSFPNTQEAPGK